MDPMEALMAGLFGGMDAPAAMDDPRRRRMSGGIAQQQYQGGSVAGPEQTLGRLLPFLLGVPASANYSGLNAGQDFSNLSFDVRNQGVGGGNVAPANPNGQSINQGGNPNLQGFGSLMQQNQTEARQGNGNNKGVVIQDRGNGTNGLTGQPSNTPKTYVLGSHGNKHGSHVDNTHINWATGQQTQGGGGSGGGLMGILQQMGLGNYMRGR